MPESNLFEKGVPDNNCACGHPVDDHGVAGCFVGTINVHRGIYARRLCGCRIGTLLPGDLLR